MKITWILLCLVASLLPRGAYADKKSLQPGEWEITVQMAMEGSTMQMPPMTMKKCVTPDQAKKPGDLFRPQRGANSCEMKDMKQEGNKFSWSVDCKDKGKGSGTVTFEPGHYEGTAQMEMVDKNGTLRKMKSTMTGRRLGDCTQ